MKIVAYTPDRYADLKKFTNEIIKPNYITIQESFFKWQFLDAARILRAADEGLFLAIDEEKTIQAISLASKTPMWMEGRESLGVWHHEWFTKPGTRGLGSDLVKHHLERNSFFGLAGQSLHAGIALQRLAPMAWFQLKRLLFPISPEATFAMMKTTDHHPLKFLKGMEISERNCTFKKLQEFDEKYSQFWETLRQEFTVCTNRTAEYMTWRYLRHPLFQYEIMQAETPGGLCVYVWREEPVRGERFNVLRMCDVLGSPEAIEQSFGALLMGPMSEDPATALVDFYGSHAETLAALKKAGMRESITLPDFDVPRLFSPLAQDIRKTINVSFLSQELSRENFFQESKMYFTKGDANQDRPNP
ncbi:MAG TPA: hypothetical protein VJN02_12075 [Gammaproteobacteria bacterium]|nr:MAG: hypothetical protein A3E83_06665 [Gammaproteobacteria bacterium RIFCSPHIGHO2_12_FULL_41_20]HLB43559.1 hypothetical protein [Gammaproteobacteria bacterium]